MRNFQIPLWLTILLWVPISFISLNHLFWFSDRLTPSMALCGVLFFLAIIGTLSYLIQKYLLEGLFLGISFFIIGLLNGPFLEPLGDPLDHVAKAYSTCGQSLKNVHKANSGFWHYTMNGVVLCSDDPFSRSPEEVLIRIRLLHSLMLALLAVGLFAVGKSTGLASFWAGVGVVITFLFMGTNRFSYFGYYSLADSSSSLLIYWIWIAVFFFKLNQKYWHIVLAFVSALILIPILYINHVQEAIFLGLICAVYLLIHFYRFIFSINNHKIYWVTIGAGLTLFFIFPQFEWFQNLLSPFFMINDWDKNQNLVVFLGPFHLMGKIWSYRVNETLGLMGFLSLPAAIAIIWMAKKKMISYKVAIIGILPLLVYCVPLLHYIWLSNCRWLPTHTRYYYRICYASLFGVTFAYLFSQIEQRFAYKKWIDLSNKNREGLFNKIIPSFKALCLITVILFSAIRSGPIYGKLDILTMDTNPWWPQWQPMLSDLSKYNKGGKPIFTDAMTGFVLDQVFNYPILEKGPRPRKGHLDLEKLPSHNKYYTLVNLAGFTPSWVPKETRHWPSRLGNTARLYSFKGERGRKIGEILDETLLPDVQFFD